MKNLLFLLLAACLLFSCAKEEVSSMDALDETTNKIEKDGDSKPLEEFNNDPISQEIYQFLYEGKTRSNLFESFNIYDKNGKEITLRKGELENKNEPITYSFVMKSIDENISCCRVDVLGWHQYDENKWLILGYLTEHYSYGVPTDQYFREFSFSKYDENGELKPPIPWLSGHWDSAQTGCNDKFTRGYGHAIPPVLTIGKYNFKVCVGFDYPNNSVNCACDDRDVWFGWPF